MSHLNCIFKLYKLLLSLDKNPIFQTILLVPISGRNIETKKSEKRLKPPGQTAYYKVIIN